jgi:hypothetical protein
VGLDIGILLALRSSFGSAHHIPGRSGTRGNHEGSNVVYCSYLHEHPNPAAANDMNGQAVGRVALEGSVQQHLTGDVYASANCLEGMVSLLSRDGRFDAGNGARDKSLSHTKFRAGFEGERWVAAVLQVSNTYPT